MDDSYHTIVTESKTEIKIKGSRFIGESSVVRTVQEISDKLEITRKREYAASHHCFAWQIGFFNEKMFKYSDDGEPSGTAGKPIFDVLNGNDLTNTLVVVTRYFGGTKLGTGGLTHAYSETAKAVLEISGKKENYLYSNFILCLDFQHYDRWLKLQHHLGAIATKTNFSQDVVIEVAIRRSLADDLHDGFIELTSGKGKIEKIES